MAVLQFDRNFTFFTVIISDYDNFCGLIGSCTTTAGLTGLCMEPNLCIGVDLTYLQVTTGVLY